MTDPSPIILWFRRDLRLADHPALTAAVATGRPLIPLFIHDEVVETHGAAPKFRLGLAVDHFAQVMGRAGSRLVLRRGPALTTLRQVIAETGAGSVWWTRLYDPDAKDRDTKVKTALRADGIDARSFAGHLLFEPWEVETGTGGPYRVFTPMWRAVRGRQVAAPLPAPKILVRPAAWPMSEDVASWGMDRALNRGRDVLSGHVTVGAAAAQARLDNFIAHKAERYATARDLPAVDATSGLSENLTYGEISPVACWHAGWQAFEQGTAGAEVFLKELVWREFAYHLVHHFPHITSRNWKPEWDAFPWNRDITPEASYLTKHLMTDWKIGLDWFADCLIDWDPASNAMGWQWAAGSGPDAAPYFRVFNPVSQLDKFDPDHLYPRRWIAEGQGTPSATALSYFAAVPRRWNIGPSDPYPAPVVAVDEGRKRALSAYEGRGF
jgi:deoxyribodipyrimidine photo-lyase